MVGNLALIRYILIRERVHIVHGHSAFSALAHETMLIGALLGLKTVFTDHSLFGFADVSAIITNKLLQISLSNCTRCICVSHTGKENTVLRARVPSERVFVIPNAVDAHAFSPAPERRPPDRINIVIVSRLVYRKGVDLMAQVIADICPRYPELYFLVCGDGPKRWLLEEVREQLSLQHRVTMLGALRHDRVRSVLVCGHIFLNTSLTEAYCMAIVEAAACGLRVVSTKVGGIPEVLPEDLIYLTEPNVPALVTAIEKALEDLRVGNVPCPYKCNLRIQEMYNWRNIAERTENVYRQAIIEPDDDIGRQLRRYLTSSVWPYLLVVVLCHLLLHLLDWLVPRKLIDRAKDFPSRSKNTAHKHRS